MNSDRQENQGNSAIREAPGAFAGSFIDALRQPLTGVEQLAGLKNSSGARDVVGPAAGQESTLTHWAHTAGSFAGSAALFIGTTGLLRRLPFAGTIAPVLAGAGLGFLQPTSDNEGINTRIGNSLLGAGTVSLLEFGPKVLGGMKLSGAVDSQLGRLAVSSAVAGAFNVQGESLLHKGTFASASETTLAALTWAGTGAAFHGLGRADETFGGNKPLSWEPAPGAGSELMSAPMMEPIQHAPVEAKMIPTLVPGVPDAIDSTSRVMAGSDLDRIYQQAQQSVGRVEILAVGKQGLEGRYGSAFAVSPGRLATADHVATGAVDVTIFDAQGKAHAAHVVGQDPITDLAVLELKNASSHDAFKPLPVSNIRPDEIADAQVVALGYPNGWSTLFASPGSVTRSHQPVFETKLLLHGTEGNSGGPLVNMADGSVLGVFKSGSRNSHFETISTPSPHLVKLLERLTGKLAPTVPEIPVQTSSYYQIGDKNSATSNLSKLFGQEYGTTRPPEFFHSKVKTTPVQLDSGTHDLTMKVQYLPSESVIKIVPIAIDKGQLSNDMHWPGTEIPIVSSELTMTLDSLGNPTGMTTTNDPLRVLQQGFNYRGSDNYLATLEPESQH